jgi:hypothetical protein
MQHNEQPTIPHRQNNHNVKHHNTTQSEQL